MALVLFAPAGFSAQYTITDLGTMHDGAFFEESASVAINNKGEAIVSYVAQDGSRDNLNRIFLYTKGKLKEIPKPGVDSIVSDINDAGTIIGAA